MEEDRPARHLFSVDLPWAWCWHGVGCGYNGQRGAWVVQSRPYDRGTEGSSLLGPMAPLTV